MFIPFYNFHALKFNPNTVLLPTWAGTTFWFLRSYKTRGVIYSALAGIGAGACMLGKYWSVFLLAGLIVAALGDRRRWLYLRSTAPWVTLVVGCAVLVPHLIWLSQHDFAPFEYAIAKHVAHSFTDIAVNAFTYLAGSAAYAAIPIIIVLVAARPDRRTIADMIWPVDAERRLVAIAFWTPLLLPIGGALASGTDLTSLWSMPAWTLLPIVMLSPPALKISPINLRRTLAAAVAGALGMLIASPAIAVAIHWIGVKPPSVAHGRLLATETERAWHQLTPQPLRYVGCDAADTVIAFAADKPHPLPLRLFRGNVADEVYADAYGWPRSPTQQSAVSTIELAQSGMALVCSADAADWVHAAAARATQEPASQRTETEIRREFLGIPGRPNRYVIFIIPPNP